MRYISWDISRLSQLVDLWNSEIGSHFPMTRELFKQNSFDDENILTEGSWMAIDDDGQIAGFIVSKIWREKINIPIDKQTGWVQVLLVRTSNRHSGIGSALLNKSEKAFREHNCKKVFLGRDPYHYFPGISKDDSNTKNWFERKGYQASGVETDLIQQYQTTDKTAKPEFKDIQFTLLQENEKEQLLSFLHRCFPGRWEYEAHHYFRKGGTGREFVLLKKNENIIGFCRINDPDSPFIAQNVYWAPLFKEPLGGIGPLGIERTERKNGYGLAIVQAAVSILRDRGIDRIVIDWTGLTKFYGKLGFKTWKEYQQFYKEL
ncbi:acetyltransferase [Bacillus sp. FJAT-18017]|uniref:GNAT family N-acetyltransferase n=1 Tax=Bacillus sp. FJAT-18017 TaxID=1705566 RepID=UPI0006AFE69B|nr:GNAT family N-acetyltransferase [Bacillus sp. FJAT-18017]ALC91436.1 acetyltransferase [Bacillus sp. FJAT-18017]